MVLYFSILIYTAFIAKIAQIIKNKSNRQNLISKILLIYVFLILFLFSAVRYGIGIDYTSYEQIFDKIRKGNIVHTEIGFNFIVKIVSQFTDDNRPLFAIFSLLTMIPIYRVIQKRSSDWALSIFLFISIGYYFFSYQNIRQYLAYMIALYALDKIIDKKYISFVIWSIVGATFHKSCLIILPAYLLAQISFRRISKILFFISGFFVIKYRSALKMVIFFFYPSYKGSIYDRINISYKNILLSICFFLLFLLCSYNKIKKREVVMLENLCLFSIYFYIFCWWVPEASRIGFFLLIPVCILFPNVLEVFGNVKQRAFLKVWLCMGSIILFYMILLAAYSPTLKLLPYQTWIDF